MAASDVEKGPFDLAYEMRSVCVRAVSRKNGKVTMLVMDQHNLNEVIAFIICDESSGKLNCSDRKNRIVFTADCGIKFGRRKNIHMHVKSSKEGDPESGTIIFVTDFKYTVHDLFLNKDDPNSNLNIKHNDEQLARYGVYKVTNTLLEEVCFMRTERMTISITYFQPMSDVLKQLLLAFSAKLLYQTFSISNVILPNIARFVLRNEEECTGAEASFMEHSSFDLSTITDVSLHRAGINKKLDMIYYDVFDRKTGMTQLTFEVTLKNEKDFNATLKSSNGSAILSAYKLKKVLNITLKQETFTFESFDRVSPNFYDKNGDKFLASKRLAVNSYPGQIANATYSFRLPEDCGKKGKLQAKIKGKGPNLVYVIFSNPLLDDRKKALVLALALGVSLQDLNSHTIPMPPIEYCYKEDIKLTAF